MMNIWDTGISLYTGSPNIGNEFNQVVNNHTSFVPLSTTMFVDILDNMTISSIRNDSDSTVISVPTTKRFTTQMLLVAIIAGALSFVTVVGNVMVMVSFKIDKQLQTISNYFLFSLAVADFAVGLISMPLFTVYTILGYWPLGPHICDAWLALDYLASNASVLNLFIISFDRYFSITRPLTYRAKRSPSKAFLMIMIAWGISLFIWPPWIYAWPYIEGKRTVPEDDCYIQFIQTNQYITFGTAIAAFYVPVSVMIILYWRIWRETMKRQKDLPNLQGGKPNSKRSTSSDDQTTMKDGDGWSSRVRSASNLADGDTDASYVSKSFDSHRQSDHRRQLKARPFTCAWIREWCIAWWHSGHEEYELDDYYWEDTASEVGFGTPGSADTTLPSTVSRCTSLNVIREPFPTSQQTKPQQNEVRSVHKFGPSRSVSNDSIYTILIRLPAADCEGIGGEGPSIKVIPEEYSKTAPASLSFNQKNRSEFCTSPPTFNRRASNIGDVRIPLNPKIIPRQSEGAALKSMIPKQLPLKKKKKATEKKAELKAAKTLSAILLAFIITWTPYNILVLLKPITAFPDYISKGVWDFFYYLCYINSTINPVVYALCNASFRRTYVRILTCKWHNRHRTAINRGLYN